MSFSRPVLSQLDFGFSFGSGLAASAVPMIDGRTNSPILTKSTNGHTTQRGAVTFVSSTRHEFVFTRRVCCLPSHTLGRFASATLARQEMKARARCVTVTHLSCCNLWSDNYGNSTGPNVHPDPSSGNTLLNGRCSRFISARSVRIWLFFGKWRFGRATSLDGRAPGSISLRAYNNAYLESRSRSV